MSYKNYADLGVKPAENVDQYSVPELQNASEIEELIRKNNVVCLDIYSTWCQPCMNTAAAYADLADRYTQPGVAVVKYDHAKMTSSERKNIQALPVYKFYLFGKFAGEVVGADIEAVEKQLEEFVGTASQARAARNNDRSGRNRGVESQSQSQSQAQEAAVSESGYTSMASSSQGPQHSRSSIRNHRNPNAPNAAYSDNTNPYQSQGNYHQLNNSASQRLPDPSGDFDKYRS